uniref:EF-hand domain-containing protein n=1 Tax=Parascaris univalens TaxID=6257 RepID=A0A915CFN2_PARUN
MSVFHHATPNSRQRREGPYDTVPKVPCSTQKAGVDATTVVSEDKMNTAPSTSERHSVTGMKLFPIDEPVGRPEVGAHIKHVTPLLKSSSKGSAPLIQGSVRKETAIATHANLHGVSPEKEMRLRELYERLDMDNDGTIDIRDLTTALKHEMPHIPTVLAPKLFARMNRVKNEKVNFIEFVQYVVEHEKKLELIFRDLDRNKDGYIDVKEIQSYCDDLGIPISDAKAQSIVERILSATEMHPRITARLRMDQRGSAAIDLSEFQEFMLFYPSSDPKDIARFWKHNLVIDIGEDSQVPEDFTQQELMSGVWWRHLVAGGVAGAMSRTCTAPLDRIKVYLQVHATWKNRLNLYRAVRLLFEEGGLKSFWRGNGVNVAKIAPESAIKFMAYEQTKRLIQRFKRDQELCVYERFMAGSSAGVISQSVIYPMEVLKTRLALRRTGQLDKGLFHFAQKMYRSEGLLCFYKGYVPNMLGIIPYAGIDLAIYETLKSLYVRYQQDSTEPGVLALLACGTCSSTCGQLASYPLALIRTRLQARRCVGTGWVGGMDC